MLPCCAVLCCAVLCCAVLCCAGSRHKPESVLNSLTTHLDLVRHTGALHNQSTADQKRILSCSGPGRVVHGAHTLLSQPQVMGQHCKTNKYTSALMQHLDSAIVQRSIVCVAIIGFVKDIALLLGGHNIACGKPGHVKPGFTGSGWVHDDDDLQEMQLQHMNCQRPLLGL